MKEIFIYGVIALVMGLVVGSIIATVIHKKRIKKEKNMLDVFKSIKRASSLPQARIKIQMPSVKTPVLVTEKKLLCDTEVGFNKLFDEWLMYYRSCLLQKLEYATIKLHNSIYLENSMFEGRYKLLTNQNSRLLKRLREIFPDMNVDYIYWSTEDKFRILWKTL